MGDEDDGLHTVKKARLHQLDDSDLAGNEALLKLKSAVQNVISSVVPNVFTELPADLQTGPTGILPGLNWDAISQSSSSQPGRRSSAELEETVKNRIDWLNSEGGFENRINHQKVIELVHCVDFNFTMKVLKDLENRRLEIRDPTGFVTAALRRAAGNDSSFFAAAPTAAAQQHTGTQAILPQMGPSMMPGTGALGGVPQLFGMDGALPPLPPLPPLLPGTGPSSSILAASTTPVLSLLPVSNSAPALALANGLQAFNGMSSMAPSPTLSVPGFPLGGGPGELGGNVRAVSSCIPPGNAAAINKFNAPPTLSCIPPGNAAAMNKSCIPPGNAAMMKKRMMKSPNEETEQEEEVSPVMVRNASPLHVSQVQLPPHLQLQQQLEQHDNQQQMLALQQQQLMALTPAAASQIPLPPASVEGQPLATQVRMLAQHAEEASQTASSAAAICGSLQDPNLKQVEMLAQTANQSAQRATWAVNWLESYFPASAQSEGEAGEWFSSMRQIVKRASEASETAAHTCRQIYNDLKVKLPEINADGKRSKVSPVPCKWFVTSWCRNGENCDYSHDPAVFEPRPLDKKRAVECMYFAKGQCTRGAGCPFAHGAEELAEINKVVHTLRTEKRLPILTKRMMDIQKGKMPFTYSSP